MAERWPDKLYAIRGGPEPGYLEAALLVVPETVERYGFEVAEYVPAEATTEKRDLRDLLAFVQEHLSASEMLHDLAVKNDSEDGQTYGKGEITALSLVIDRIRSLLNEENE